MANKFRVPLSLIVLNLSLLIPAFAQSNSIASTPIRSTADEDSLRALTEQYGQALMSGDVGALRKFWNPQSPNLAAQVRNYKSLFVQTRLELIASTLTRLEVSGDRAVSQLTTDERRFDKKTGAVLMTFDPFYGACRSFEWIKTSAGWQIEREVLVQDELAVRLLAADSDKQLEEILEKEKRYVNNTLVFALGAQLYRHNTRAEYEQALRYVELQRKVAERIGDQAGIGAAWLNLAMVRHAQEEPELGLSAAHKALAIYEGAGIKRGIGLAQDQLSKFYRIIGDHRRAFEFAQKALRLAQEINHRRAMMFALADLAAIYGQQNNSEQSLAHLEKALVIARELDDTIKIATLQTDIAIQSKESGDYVRALAIAEELLKQVGGSGDQSGAAMVRDQIGRIYADQEKYDEALKYHYQALSELRADKTRRAAAVSLNNISMIYLLQGKYSEALSVSEEAVALSRETGRRGDLSLALTNVGYSQLGLNRVSAAQESFSEAVAIREKLRSQTAGGLEERQRHFERGLRAHHGLLGVLVRQDQPENALMLAERVKARALLDMLQQGGVRVHKTMTASERGEEQRLRLELTQLNKQLASLAYIDKQNTSRIAAVEAQLEKARLNYEAFQNTLYTTHPELKTQRGEAPIINVQELTGLLPNASSVLLEYVVTDEQIYLFAITKPKNKAEIAVYTVPIQRAQLATQIGSFRQQLATRHLGFRAAASKLYDLLLKPAQAQLVNKTNVVIAPDSDLWDLPFQALLNGNGRFMIESASISYAPSLTVLREMTNRRMNQTNAVTSATLLAIGNPVSGGETVVRNRSNLRNHNLDPLPEAGEEVKALGRLYGPSRSRIYVGSEAREDLLKKEVGEASILHFTTHGTLNNASPMYSHLTLAEGGPSDDGLLEAWEFMQLDLKAELAVLSACETARGRIGAGEGMIGFSWAMFIAGVPSLVVSQWKIESAGTRDLMVNFHRSLISPAAQTKSKATKAQALRQAALKLLKNPETSHPFYWAGFVLVGDGG